MVQFARFWCDVQFVLVHGYRTPGEVGHPNGPANQAETFVFAVTQAQPRSKLNIVEIALKSKVVSKSITDWRRNGGNCGSATPNRQMVAAIRCFHPMHGEIVLRSLVRPR